jgi:hypothetical protein
VTQKQQSEFSGDADRDIFFVTALILGLLTDTAVTEIQVSNVSPHREWVNDAGESAASKGKGYNRPERRAAS